MMTSLLKSFGKGCLYILVLPVLLVILACYLVVGIVIFAYIGIKAVYLFFTGRNLAELPEDLKAREILEGINEGTVTELETPKVETPTENDYASHYYVPLDQNIPPVEEIKNPSELNNEEENKEGEQ